MRTTVDLPDELLQQAREAAAQERTTLTALLTDGLRLRLHTSSPRETRPLPVAHIGGGMQPWVDPASNASIYDAADRDAAP